MVTKQFSLLAGRKALNYILLLSSNATPFPPRNSLTLFNFSAITTPYSSRRLASNGRALFQLKALSGIGSSSDKLDLMTMVISNEKLMKKVS